MIASALLTLFSYAAIQAQPQDALTVFEHVSIVRPGSDKLLPDQSVVIRGSRIISVQPSEGFGAPVGARLIDGQGKFLMPGLSDMHVHLSDPRDGLLYVASGVTTVRNLSGQPFHIDIADAYQEGRWIGPTLRSSGPQVRLAANAKPYEAQELVEQHQAQGYDSIKLYGRTTMQCYEAMAEASQALGMPIDGHIPRNLSLEDIVEVGGHREISHTEELLYAFMNQRKGSPEELLEECVGLVAEAGVYITPTIAVYAGIAEQVADLGAVLAQPAMEFVPPLGRVTFSPAINKYSTFDQGDIPGLQRGTQTILALTGAMAAADIPLLLGTDAMNPSVIPGDSIFDELEYLVQAGLSPTDALATGTINVARFWDASSEFGRVKAGQRADLILLNANPIEDIENVRKQAGVMLRGRWFTRQELDQSLAAQRASYEPEESALMLLTRESPAATLGALASESVQPAEGFYLSLASIFLLLGNLSATEAILDQALSIYPDDPMLINRMAEIQALAGDPAGARESYLHCLALAPKNRVAQHALEKLNND